MMPFLGIEQSLNAGFSLDMSSDRFTGKPYSSSIGLYYDLHRWYDPSIGRFISPDPKHGHLSNPQSLNLYIYVVDRPTSLTDPTGLDACGWNPLSWGGCVNNAGQAASNWWNSQDQDTKIAIILVVATVAIVATAGLAAPAVLPTVLTGIAIGATTSTATYAATTVATGGTITAKGLFTSAAVGAFLGAATAGVGSWLSGARAGASASASLESIANSEADTGVNLSSHFLTTNHISDIARGFTGYSGNTADAMSLISDTLDTGSFNEARSSVDPLRLVFEKVYAGGSGPLGLRAVWDVVSQELWTAYPFPVVD